MPGVAISQALSPVIWILYCTSAWANRLKHFVDGITTRLPDLSLPFFNLLK